MGRRRTIIIDPADLLAGIARHTAATVADFEALIAEYQRRRLTYGLERAALRDVHELGVRIDFVEFLDRPLTASERIRAQECLRGLAQAGLVTLHGRRTHRVKLTEAGVARVSTEGAS